MKKRTFLRLSTGAVAGAICSPMISWNQKERLKNWAGNIEYSTDQVFYPDSVDEVVNLVKKYDKLKVLGTRHCFNRIADSTYRLISLKNLDQIISLDKKARTVTVQPGVTYGKLGPYLQANGFALHNLASLPHISVVGACTTATHGSGVHNGNLATAAVAIEWINANGELMTRSLENDPDLFKGSVVGLGALGVITSISLQIQPTFNVRQDVYQQLPLEQLKSNFEEIVSSGYSVSLFTDWQSESINEVWIKSRIGEPQSSNLDKDFFGASRATKNLHPIASLSAENCTEQLGHPGPWFERLPHFKMGFTPSSGKELQSEYFVPFELAIEAIQAVQKLGPKIGPYLFIIEIRTIAADELWMSPCYQQKSVTIHFTWKQDWPAVSALLPQIEEALSPFSPRPHWGKLFTIDRNRLQSNYKKLPEFLQLIANQDPQGKFRNEFLENHIYRS